MLLKNDENIEEHCPRLIHQVYIIDHWFIEPFDISEVLGDSPKKSFSSIAIERVPELSIK